MKYNLYNCRKLYIDKSEKRGRGVFTTAHINAGDLIEQCHFIVPKENQGGKDPELRRYFFRMFDHTLSEEYMATAGRLALRRTLPRAVWDNFSVFDKPTFRKLHPQNTKSLGYESQKALLWSAIVLGFGAILNHSSDYNVVYNFNKEDYCFDFVACADISPGEELFNNYGNDDRKDIQ